MPIDRLYFTEPLPAPEPSNTAKGAWTNDDLNDIYDLPDGVKAEMAKEGIFLTYGEGLWTFIPWHKILMVEGVRDIGRVDWVHDLDWNKEPVKHKRQRTPKKVGSDTE